LIAVFASVTKAANGELLGGWEGDTRQQGYGFIGIGTSAKLKNSTAFVSRLTTSYLYYNFDHDDSTTKVLSPGVSLMAGFSHTVRDFTVNILAGPELRWNDEQTRRKNSFVTISRDQRVASGVIQGYLNAPLANRTWVTVLANYNGANRYAFSRLSLERRLGVNMTAVGLEATAQGNEDIKSMQLGAFVGIPRVVGQVSFRVSGGIKNFWNAENTHKSAGVAGLGFYTRF